jgi:hypothetical protein
MANTKFRQGRKFNAHAVQKFDLDYLLIVGDLNYRVDLPYETAGEIAGRSNITGLVQMISCSDF